METIAILECKLSYIFKGSPINIEALSSSTIPNKIKNEFGFQEVIIEDDFLEFRRGRTIIDTSETILSKLRIEDDELSVSILEQTNIARAVLDKLSEIIKGPWLVDPMVKRREATYSKFKARLNIPPEKLFSDKYLSFLNEISESFVPEGFNFELHPYYTGIGFVITPDLSKISLHTKFTELTDLLADMDLKRFELSIKGVRDFYDKIYTLEADIDFKTASSILSEFENLFASKV